MLLTLGLLSCTNKTPIKVVSVLYDTTDEKGVPIQAEELIRALDITKDDWNEKVFRFQTITGSDYNKINAYSLPKENSILGNSIQRNKKIKSFQEEIKKLENIPIEEHNKSSIFLPLIRELTYLSKEHKDANIVCILYSDLNENSDWMNLYRHSKKNSQDVIQAFTKHLPKIKTTGNIEVKIIYQPSEEENKAFREIVSMYRELLEKLNINLTVGASL
jgi:hypothetical protein